MVFQPVSLDSIPEAVEQKMYRARLPARAEINYELILKGTSRRRPLITDGLGFRYSQKEDTNTWRCTSRTKNEKTGRLPCTAYLHYENKDEVERKIPKEEVAFHPHASEQPHNHAGKLGTGLRSKIIRDAKELAVEDPFVPTGTIFQKDLFLSPYITKHLPSPSL